MNLGFNALKFFLVFAFFLLPACVSPGIYDDPNYNPPVYWGVHTVEKGESISSIAWRYSRDYRELADANNLSPPFELQVGQHIRLDERGDPTAFEEAIISSKTAGHKDKIQDRSVISPRPDDVEDIILSDFNEVNGVRWQWPAKGSIVKRFGEKVLINKGVNISGDSGDSVLAAAAGKVVYAGSGVVGYGNMVIIDHDGPYLSAYAHTKDIYANPGDVVDRGAVIASMGAAPSGEAQLHFEIRKGGQAYNPLNYLPKKGSL